jgi:hypothetical protein
LQLGILGQVVVSGAGALDRALQVRRQRFPAAVLVGEQRAAAVKRQFLRVQHRAEAGHRLVRQVRVPVMAGVAQPDRLAILLDIRDDQHLGIARQLELAQHVDLQRAETAAEFDLLGRRDAGAPPTVFNYPNAIVE